MGSELYIYWRVARADVAAASIAVRGWQRDLMAAHPGLSARLLQRVDDDGDVLTLMETYVPSSDGADAGEAWQARITGEGDAVSARWRQGLRHIEVFRSA